MDKRDGVTTSSKEQMRSSVRVRVQGEITSKGAKDQGGTTDDVVGVLDRQTYLGGTRCSRLCGEDHDRETKNSKVCTRTRDTRFIQVRAAKVASPTSCLRDQV
jgi:hypothetical protein